MNDSAFKRYTTIHEYGVELGREVLLFTFIEVPIRAALLSYNAADYLARKSVKVYNQEGGIEYYKISLNQILKLISAKSQDCNMEPNNIMREYCKLKSMNNQLKSLNGLRATCKYANDSNACSVKITNSILELKNDIYNQQEKINKLEIDRMQLNKYRK